MEVSALLKKAWSAVEDAGLPDEIQPLAFREAVRLLSPVAGAQGGARSGGGKPGGDGGNKGAANGDSNDGQGAVVVTEDEIYDRVATQAGIDRHKLEGLVHLDDDGLRISLPGLKLGKTNSDRARAVAQILTITRGFGLAESETSLEVIRTECDRLKVYDSANFSAHIKGLSGYVINGTGPNRRLRAKGPGIQAFATLVEGLVGES